MKRINKLNERELELLKKININIEDREYSVDEIIQISDDTTLNGEDCVYTGDCRLIDPFGIPFKISRSGVVETVYGELDYSLLENWRKEFPVLDDMDDFEIKSNN